MSPRLLSMLLFFCISTASGQSQGPHFTETHYKISVNETFEEGGYPKPEPGFLIVTCNYTNDTLEYTIMTEDNIPFSINLTTGEISVTQDLDYESVTSYNFTAVCTVENDFTLNDTATITVHLLPVNEHRPVISSISMFTAVTEDTLPGLLDTTLPGVAYNVSDMDQPPDTIHYTIKEPGNHEMLVYNETLQGIVLTRQYDQENLTTPTNCSLPQIHFRITVCDIYPPNIHCPNVLLTVSLFPSNDNTPVFSQDSYSVTIPETTPTNSVLMSVTCTDEDLCFGGFEGLEIASTELNDKFSVDNNGSIFNLQPLDYERNASYNVTVRCFDSRFPSLQREAFTSVLIHLTDVNDNAPRCVQPGVVNLQAGTHRLTTLLRLSCEDDDTGVNSQLTFMVDGELPQLSTGQFSLNSTTGVLTFAGDIDSSTSEFNFTVVVSDRGSTPLTSRVDISINVVGVGDLQPEPTMPMLFVIILCVIAGAVLLSCLILLCCCCCYCLVGFRRRKKDKATLPTLPQVPVVTEKVHIENVNIETQNSEGEVALFLEDTASLQSYNLTTGDYIVTNTTVLIGEGEEEEEEPPTISIEVGDQELKEDILTTSCIVEHINDTNPSPSSDDSLDPNSTSSFISQPLDTRDNTIQSEITEM